MSRVGKKIIFIPEGIKVEVNEQNLINISYNEKKIQYQFNPLLNINIKDNYIQIARKNNQVFMKKIHGTTRALLFNMITGLKKSFIKKIEIVGLGYDVEKKDSKLIFNLGFSHTISLIIPSNLEIEIIKNKEIIVKGIDKQFVGEFAAKILKLRKPEPYKGKGIRLFNQYIHRKVGKSAKK
ncbi:MAG: 50S ribosomal protein L6 [Candidatus Phytoplasma stylosanthis]|uniref:50S ribosomal protein L6 n=1 Tax=Candidatus Phytoplasma stylosanthis TaxID=2798314 RepID=UPI00293A9F08|nr:50S ribosomal protein L6 [Candidatus Phytoplasma stylosanthis]MDV3167853.1 50S ribosomal protein L6 [Candidatus Phytoplasma stylosanthis]MDV3170871.1 50S ribosomal protein L6 [Candidatus Phytoplasma stylosanthis]MDV3173503.1 50S ribosomal protein L6 [Candidatus Phytoplasma stylosanthis]MDV3174051.1 50S ribosomal protein L6 [Candidatus Phytoplasma stylosanthis]MDV3202437.1 50S ribosomal protein L6 [Candidatus Phytoplasma stylosanthis]